jgi:Protein of unknown function (DUF3300)
MKKPVLFIGAALALIGLTTCDDRVVNASRDSQSANASSSQAPPAKELDQLLAPIALYPDQLLAQILLCAMDPKGVTALDQFIKRNKNLKGSALQDAALKDKFEPSFVALTIFPDTVAMMATQLDWTTKLGQAFAADRPSVFGSIQRLRAQAREAGNLKTTPQQEVATQTTSSGDQVIVIEPANPQVVYVPQYNPTTVYVQQPTTTTVVVQDNSSTDAAVAGLIGFTAGIAIGAAIDNDYYYGRPYGWYGGGAYMYNDAWDDYYDHREDAREDWMDHREELSEDRNERARDAQDQRTERQENRVENRPETTQAQRDQAKTQAQERASTARASGTTGQSGARTGTQAQTQSRGSGTTGTATTQRSTSTRSSDAFSGYSSGQSQQRASSRGQSSRGSASRSRGSGGSGRRR